VVVRCSLLWRLCNPTLVSVKMQHHVKKIINVLEGNIKQWSFIESQLLEPNVNLGMVRARLLQSVE
jgi:hypothetical protein